MLYHNILTAQFQQSLFYILALHTDQPGKKTSLLIYIIMTNILKSKLTPKWSFCYYLLIIFLFQTCMAFFKAEHKEKIFCQVLLHCLQGFQYAEYSHLKKIRIIHLDFTHWPHLLFFSFIIFGSSMQCLFSYQIRWKPFKYKYHLKANKNIVIHNH